MDDFTRTLREFTNKLTEEGIPKQTYHGVDVEKFFNEVRQLREKQNDCTKEHENNIDKMLKEAFKGFKRKSKVKVETPKLLWLTREADDADGNKGELSLFYDSPLYRFNYLMDKQEWCMARKLCSLPSYMYPEVTFENSPVVFKMETDLDIDMQP